MLMSLMSWTRQKTTIMEEDQSSLFNELSQSIALHATRWIRLSVMSALKPRWCTYFETFFLEAYDYKYQECVVDSTLSHMDTLCMTMFAKPPSVACAAKPFPPASGLNIS